MSILICMPIYDRADPATFKSLWDLEIPDGMDRPGFEYMKGYGAAQARNLCARECLDMGYDHLMFVDSDIFVPCDCLGNMLEGDADIVLGIYPRKNAVQKSVVFLNGCDDFTDDNCLMMDGIPSVPRIDVKGGGLGCAMIRAGLLEKMEYPWFKYIDYPDGGTLSEDLYFCWMASKAGAKIQCDTRVRCMHRMESWAR